MKSLGFLGGSVQSKKDIQDFGSEISEAVMTAAMDGLYIVGLDGKIYSANPTFCAMTGYSQEELLKLQIRDIDPNWSPERVTLHTREVTQKATIRFETKLRRKDQQIRDVEVSGHLHKSNSGESLLYCFVRDITDRKESEEKYRRLFETLTDAFLIFDTTTGLFVEANEAAQKLYGYTREEFLKLHHLEITAEREQSALTLKRIIKGEIGKVPLRYHKRKDGTIFPTDIMATTITVGGHALVYGIIKDITESMKAKEALEKANELLEQRVAERTEALRISEARNRFLSEGTFEGILIHNKATIIDCNNSFAKMYGYEPPELIGMNGIELFAPESRETGALRIQTDQTEPYEAIGLRKDGSTFPIEIHAKMLDYDGRKVRFVSCWDITERKQAQDALRKANEELELRVFERTKRLAETNTLLQESEHRFSQVVENIGAVVWEVDADGLYTYISPMAETVFGYTPEEIVGKKHFYDFFYPEDRDPLKKDAFEVFAKKDVFRNFENRNINKNGQVIWLSTSGTPILDDDGRLRGYRGVDEDITDSKRAKDELAARERTLLAMLDSFPYLAMLLDTKGTILAINDAMCKYHKKSRDQLIGTSVADHIQPHIFEHRWQLVEKVITSRKPVYFEDEFDNRILAHSFIPVFGSEGNVTGITVYAKDITVEKHAEQELAAREKTLRTLIDSFPYRTVLIDKNGIILAANNATCLRLGKSRSELVGTNIGNYVPPEVQRTRMYFREKVILSGKPVHYEDENNGMLSVISVFPVFGSDGKVANIAIFARDITQERESEKELERYREKMMRAERLAAIGTMSAMVAHQLNQPLTVMRLLLQDAQESLKSGKFKKTIDERVANILIEVDKAGGIVKNLLQWSRPSSVNHRQSLSLMDIVKRIVKFLSETARRAGIQVTLDAGLNDIGELVGNQMEFEQIFFIMIENAIHAAEGKEGCCLRIGGKLEDQYVNLTFSDTCGGIEPVNIDQLFEPFFTTKAPDKGTGLGLPIVKRIVESYGGSIRVESSCGQGTIFYIRMPLAMLK